MNDRIQVKGLGKLDGEYEVDAEKFTNRDLHTIKQIAGVRAGELEEAWASIDNDLLVAFTVVALRKQGFTVDNDVLEAIWDADLGSLTFVAGDEEETDAGPPSQTPSGPGVDASDSANPTRSGADSRNGGDPQVKHPSPTGSPSSDTTAASRLETSRT